MECKDCGTALREDGTGYHHSASCPSAASDGSPLVDAMAAGLRAYKQAFSNLNNNDDPAEYENYRCALMKEHINFGRLLKRYDAGER
jgi:hypothetical protein